MSDLPFSALERPVDNTGQWLRNLKVDFDNVNQTPPTPSSAHTEPVSTPSLPSGIEESEGTATPGRFEPENEGTVSDRTYDTIRTYQSAALHPHLAFCSAPLIIRPEF